MRVMMALASLSQTSAQCSTPHTVACALALLLRVRCVRTKQPTRSRLLLEHSFSTCSWEQETPGGLDIHSAQTQCSNQVCHQCMSSIRGLQECVYCLIQTGDCATTGIMPEQTRCRRCSPGTAQGDAAPLHIYPLPKFVYTAIGQTEYTPFAMNVLTITLESNVVLERLYSGRVVISGLDMMDLSQSLVDLYSDRLKEDGSAEVQCYQGDPCDLFRACIDPVQPSRCKKASASWDNDNKILSMYVSDKMPIIYHDVEDGRPLSFALRLRNGAASDNLASPKVAAFGVSQTGSVVDIIESSSMPTGLGFTWLSTKTIGQSSPYPGAFNTLTMTMTPTQTMSPSTGMAISVSALMGKTWPTASPLNLTDPTGRQMHRMFMDAYPNGRIGLARWRVIENEPTLIFFLATEWVRDTEIILQFQVYNPSLPVNINAIRVSVAFTPTVSPDVVSSLVLHQATIKKIAMDYDLTTVLNVVGAVAGDAHPLVVFPAKFTYAEIFQSTSVPRATSTVTLRFSTSVPLDVNQTMALTFPDNPSKNVWTELSGSYSLHGTHKEYFKAGTTAPRGTACWSQGRPDAQIEGIQLMFYIAQTTFPNVIYEVSIDLTNPLPVPCCVTFELQHAHVIVQLYGAARCTCVLHILFHIAVSNACVACRDSAVITKFYSMGKTGAVLARREAGSARCCGKDAVMLTADVCNRGRDYGSQPRLMGALSHVRYIHFCDCSRHGAGGGGHPFRPHRLRHQANWAELGLTRRRQHPRRDLGSKRTPDGWVGSVDSSDYLGLRRRVARWESRRCRPLSDRNQLSLDRRKGPVERSSK